MYNEAQDNKTETYWKYLIYGTYDSFTGKRVVCTIAFRFRIAEVLDTNECLYVLEPTVYISRFYDEDIRMNLGYGERSVEEYERIAKLFKKFADNNIR